MFPAEAGIGDADAVRKLRGIVAAWREFLCTRVDVTFDHCAEDTATAMIDLASDLAHDVELPLVPFTAVPVRTIDHQRGGHAGPSERSGPLQDTRLVIVRCRAAAQDDVTIRVATGADHRDQAAFVHAEKVMRPRSRLDRIAGNLYVSVGAVLEADRRRAA